MATSLAPLGRASVLAHLHLSLEVCGLDLEACELHWIGLPLCVGVRTRFEGPVLFLHAGLLQFIVPCAGGLSEVALGAMEADSRCHGLRFGIGHGQRADQRCQRGPARRTAYPHLTDGATCQHLRVNNLSFSGRVCDYAVP